MEMKKANFPRLTFTGVSRIVLGGIAIGSVLGFCGQIGSWFDIFSEFRAVYILLLLILIAIFVWTKRPWLITGSLLLLFVNGLTFIPFYFDGSHRSNSGRSQLRVLELNVFGKNNRQTEKALDLIKRSNPDLIGVSEVTGQWMLVFQKELKQYPYQVYEPRYGGVALLSKLPLKNSSVKYFGKIKRPRITASTLIGGQNVQIIFAHPVIPLYRNGSRDEELKVLASEVKSAQSATILFGDLNATPWSHNFNKLVKDGGLIDSEKGFGFQPTWFAFLSPVLTLFPIDHCLVTDDFVVVDRCLLGSIGSDHFPLQVDLAFKR
jgi:endonuclease/exonuclease/phosphatase (EEP) superfamily protein YafD